MKMKKMKKKAECPSEFIFALLQERRRYWDEQDIIYVCVKTGMRYKKDVYKSIPAIDVMLPDNRYVARFLKADDPFQDFYLFWVNAGIEEKPPV